MATFQQLMRGAAEKIAKRQAELDELQKAAAKRFELETAARNHFSGQDPEGGLRLYHGSPYNFDRFDFEKNLLKGEGAMSFGPGGYMTGHEPLAREYARNLFDRHGSAADSHRGIRLALETDPKAAAQYLRALQVGKMQDAGIGEGSTRNEVRTMTSLPPHLRNLPPNYIPYVSTTSRVSAPTNYALESRTTASGIDDYLKLAESVGIPPQKQPTRIGRGGISPLEAIRRGKELERAMGGRPDIRPRLQERLSPIDQTLFGWQDVNDYMQDMGGGFSLSGMTKVRNNLNSTWRLLNDRPGPAGYIASMGGHGNTGRVDLRDPRFTMENPELARRLYEAPFDAKLEDMLSYDYPLRTAGPRTIGALTQLADKYGFTDRLHPDMLGHEALRALQDKVRSPLAQMQALKEAGLPGMYFERGGRRGSGQIPDQFKPDNYNYVIFDQDKLGPPKKTEFSTGGVV